MSKRLRWAKWGLLPLSVAALAAIIIANPLSQTTPAHPSFDIMSPSEAADLRAQLRTGHIDADAIKRPTANREGSPSSADEQFARERAYPASDVPAAGYSNGFSQYSLTNENGGAALQWQQLGPLSTPNGSSWGNAAASTVSGRATAMAVDPATCAAGSCQTIYLGTANGGVWKTTNGGQSWTPLTEHQSTLAVGSITLDPHNANIIYVGTGEPNNSIDSNRGQGILKSTDGGHSWTTLGFNTFVNRSVGDLVVDPANGNLYAISYLARSGGAGTTYGSSTNNPYLPKVGFYRSIDGGQTWAISNPTSTLFTDATGRTGPTSLIRASNGALFVAIYGQGIYTSTDGGQHWTALPNAAETTFDRITLAVAPSNPSVVYAAYSHDIDGNGGMTFYASTNGGQTWTQQAKTPSACDGQCWYDMPVAVSPTAPSTVYVGGSFNYNACATTYPYTNCTTVVMKSTDGGATWHDLGDGTTGVNVHPDDHVVLATAQGGLYTANDGGLYHSTDDGVSWQSLNNAIGSLQFQSVAVNSNGVVFGGTQDNGTWAINPGGTNGVHVLGGDGGMTAADPSNANIVFDEYYGSQLQRYDASNGSQTWMAGWWCDYFCFGGGLFYEPVAMGTKTPTGASATNNVFSGTYRLWRSTQGGGTNGNPNQDGDATNDSSDTTDWVPITPNVGNIAAIAISPVNPNVVAFATSTGAIYYTTNALAPVTLANACDTHKGDVVAAYCSRYGAKYGLDPTFSGAQMCSQPWTNVLDTSSFCDYVSGVTWTRLDKNGSGAQLLPGRWVSSLTFAPGSASTLLATFSGFDENTSGFAGHVFTTTNAGAAGGTVWHNISGTGKKAIPDIPANAVVEAPNGLLYVAADFGVYLSRDGGQSWQRDDKFLPNSPVYDLAISPNGSTLYAATHGRGIWSAAIHG